MTGKTDEQIDAEITERVNHLLKVMLTAVKAECGDTMRHDEVQTLLMAIAGLTGFYMSGMEDGDLMDFIHNVVIFRSQAREQNVCEVTKGHSEH